MAILKGNQSDDLTLKYLLQNNKTDTSGIESDIDTLKETTQNLSEEINELDGEAVKDVKVDGTSVVTSNIAEIDLTGKSNVGHTHIASDITDFPTYISMKLLWTNSDPTTNFAAQTVSLDLSGYDAILFSYHNFATTNAAYALESAFCIKGETTYAGISARDNNRDGGRLITPSDSGVDIGDMVYNGSTNNGYGIPLKIYGIKGIT